MFPLTNLKHQHEQSKRTTSGQRADPGQRCSVFALLWAHGLSRVDLYAAQAGYSLVHDAVFAVALDKQGQQWSDPVQLRIGSRCVETALFLQRLS